MTRQLLSLNPDSFARDSRVTPTTTGERERELSRRVCSPCPVLSLSITRAVHVPPRLPAALTLSLFLLTCSLDDALPFTREFYLSLFLFPDSDACVQLKISLSLLLSSSSFSFPVPLTFFRLSGFAARVLPPSHTMLHALVRWWYLATRKHAGR